ncbi:MULTISPECIES: type II toxin-antitoxin system RatA family toxin [unclassified Bosea (in: a-proteobacteria)]|uniref:type II toxin-antitoxin system RatA family toxin n=1 Tax=unclassified Bosea (in: a-proteobacteria) TaxID=2653178 RepID=UPI000F7648FE|nr:MULTISPECIES: type II toxin-antitoxin system RatA family toxin [unclassified Bosea (in: a-proteobacteria)]AZO77294.1 ubiquinone-binding protein [Bosea sp. Tri-49]RXT22148.1 ubiquinone-binding protein [Bosea sp. Tri-39]RXT32490.1 ubiquinone-binding protein [Bosea sp. Tri-54]
MPMFNNTRRVKHSPAEMYALVADVENYPQFLPLCEGLTVRRRTPRDGGGEVVLADMTVGYKAIRETFTSRVTLDPTNLKILVEYVDGPFRYLENRWSFKPHDKGCEIGFFISYEFASRMLGLLMGAMFDKAFHKFAEAFEKRADAIYGRNSPAALT